MFNFLNDIGNHNQRVVRTTEINSSTIDTAAVSDGSQPYETAVRHPSFNDGKWMIVESYGSRTEAECGHARWVEQCKAGLPDEIAESDNAMIGQLITALGGPTVHRRTR